MLFVCKGASLESILLPDANEAPDKPQKWAHADQHPDGSPATVHHAGLVYRKAQEVALTHVLLKGLEVRINEDGTNAASSSLSGLPLLSNGLPGSVYPDGTKAATTVLVKDGSIAKHEKLEVGDGKYMGTELQGVAARLTYDHEVTVAAYRGDDKVWSCTLDNDSELAIYNFDAKYADFDELTEQVPCKGTRIDNDFKWIYSLLSGDGAPKETLRAPMIYCHQPNDGNNHSEKIWNITIFTCFPAVWDNGSSSLMSSGAKSSKGQSRASSLGRSKTRSAPARPRKKK
jgi:hypothetical protein